VLTTKQKNAIVAAYTKQLTPMVALAEQYGITRQGIYKVLRKAGVDTTKRKISVACSFCGAEHMRTKGMIRKCLNKFCGAECYFAFLDAGKGIPSIDGNPYVYNKQGQRLGRKIVEAYYTLSPGEIVHHEDRDTNNNDLSNLRVFASQGEHVRYHRGFEVAPLWSGA